MCSSNSGSRLGREKTREIHIPDQDHDLWLQDSSGTAEWVKTTDGPWYRAADCELGDMLLVGKD